MKRLILFLAGILLVLGCGAQNNFKYIINANGGIAITAPLSIGGVTITTTGAQFNFINTTTSNVQTQLNSKLAITDTTAMLSHYIERKDTASMLSHYIERKDTATMLTHYIERKDTATMLSKYETDVNVAKKLNKSDTATMLSHYIERKDTSDMLDPYVREADTLNLWEALDTVNITATKYDLLPHNYYISNTGSDAANGFTPVTSWQTVAKVNSSTFIPGSNIYFNCGDIWREALTVPSSGTSAKYITFGSYGSGSAPQILGSTEVTTWTLSHGNVWYSFNAAYIDPGTLSYYGNTFFKAINGSVTWGTVEKATWGDLAAEYDWAWVLDTLYIYSPTDPNTRYSGVEMAQRNECIDLNKKDHLIVDGLEIAYSGRYGIKCGDPNYSELSGLIIKNCDIHHFGSKSGSGGYALSLWYSDMLIQNNIIHDASRRNISLYLTTQVINPHNIVIEGNTMYDGYHTSSVDIATGAAGTWDDITIRNNLIYQNTNAIDAVENPEATGMFIAVSGTLAGAITNVYIYNNIFKTPNQWSLMLEHANSVYIYNNTFYGTNATSADNGGFITMSLAGDHVIKNNIFYNDMAWADAHYFRCINAPNTVTSCTIDYNLYYTTDADQSMVTWQGTTYTTAQWAAYKAASSQDANSPDPADPLFETGSTIKLQSTSTAINAGTLLINIPKLDYFSNKRIGIFDIGAFEKQIDN